MRLGEEPSAAQDGVTKLWHLENGEFICYPVEREHSRWTSFVSCSCGVRGSTSGETSILSCPIKDKVMSGILGERMRTRALGRSSPADSSDGSLGRHVEHGLWFHRFWVFCPAHRAKPSCETSTTHSSHGLWPPSCGVFLLLGSGPCPGRD